VEKAYSKNLKENSKKRAYRVSLRKKRGEIVGENLFLEKDIKGGRRSYNEYKIGLLIQEL